MVAVNDSLVPGWDSPDYFRLFSEGSPSNESTRPGRSAAFGLPGNHGGSNGTGGGSAAGGSVGSGNNSATVAAAVANGAYQVYYPGDSEGSRNDTRVGRGEPGGSNFMLLLEDFGEYFYNYNGTGPPNDTLGLGGTSAGFPINCTVANSTCDVPSEGE